MGWISALSETYDRCKDQIGIPDEYILLPVSHSTANAQLEVTIDIDGNFISANAVDKLKAMTIIPATEDSATRSSGIMPHPLCDKLCYIAGDYAEYVQDDKDKDGYYAQYIKALEEWSQSSTSNEKVKAVFRYLKRGKTVKDLVENKVLQIDEDGYINHAKLGNISQEEAFVRFIVEKPHASEYEAKVWEDRELFQEFESYYLKHKEGQEDNRNLCYVEGRYLPASAKHPAKIRNTGDKAKIISANDSLGYTFRGRFTDAGQAVSISYLASQKAHNALRWLIQKQGYRNESEMIVCWCVEGLPVPNPCDESMVLFSEFVDDDNKESMLDVGTSYAKRLNNAMAGYKSDLGTNSKIVVMSVDSADGSGQGRLSITFYSELEGTEFLHNIKKMVPGMLLASHL